MEVSAQQNPILTQIKLLKNKLLVQGKTIKQLTGFISLQQRALQQIIFQFQKHQASLILRLSKLEQINIRYIKNYLQLKQQQQFSDIAPISNMFFLPAKEHLLQKIKEIKSTNLNIQPAPAITEAKHMVSNCINLMQNYLRERKLNYDQIISKTAEERRKRMKDVKGLQEFKKNKEEAKIIEELSKKSIKLQQKLQNLDSSNALGIFLVRQDIQKDIKKLGCQEVSMDLENSLNQQKVFKGIIQQLISCNLYQHLEDSSLLQGSLDFVSDKIKQYSDIYGTEFVEQSINQLENSSPQFKEKIEKLKLSSGSRTQIENQKNDNNYFVSRVAQEKQVRDFEKPSDLEFSKKKRGLQFQGGHEEQQVEQQSQHLQIRRDLGNRRKSAAPSNRLNTTFQSTKTKVFFQDQQKTRDQLIRKQTTQIGQHQKVIDKLITFIKKQFKDRKMDDFQGDDPQQLMQYYFKVNKKEYLTIQDQMNLLQKETSKKVDSLSFENRQLNLRLNQIQEKNQTIIEKYQKNSFQLHILISRTEDLVKLSLETLINTCMKAITPHQLIIKLEKIIQMIRDSIQQKRNTTYRLTIKSDYAAENIEKQPIVEYYKSEGQLISSPKSIKNEGNSDHIQQIVPLLQQHTPRSQIVPPIIQQFIRTVSEASQKSLKSVQGKEQNKSSDNILQKKEDSGEVDGFDENFIKNISEKLQIIKHQNQIQINTDELYDMKDLYRRYKELETTLNIADQKNRQNELKYQRFLESLKKKGALQAPFKMEQKIFYMQKLIAEQDQLLQNQRIQYQQTILKQVKESEKLAQMILKDFKRRNSTHNS